MDIFIAVLLIVFGMLAACIGVYQLGPVLFGLLMLARRRVVHRNGAVRARPTRQADAPADIHPAILSER